MELYQVIVIVLLVLILLSLLFLIKCIRTNKQSTYTPLLRGGEPHLVRVLFIGTVPTFAEEDNKERFLGPDKRVRDPHFKDFNPARLSNFYNINKYLDAHKDTVEPWFMLNTKNIFMSDEIKIDYEKYGSQILDYDLRVTTPEEIINTGEIKPFDIVYIDTNTCGYINSSMLSDFGYWLRFFKPLVAQNGCIVCDDDEIVCDKKFTQHGYERVAVMAMKLVNSICEGFTAKFMYFKQKIYLDPFLRDFVAHVSRNEITDVKIYFRVNSDTSKQILTSLGAKGNEIDMYTSNDNMVISQKNQGLFRRLQLNWTLKR